MIKSTEAKPGKPVVMKLRDDEEAEIMEWLNLQVTYSDSIRYLIQKEIAENGLRNLQLYVPQTRTIASIKAQLASVPAQVPDVSKATAQSNVGTPPPSYQPSTERETTSITQEFQDQVHLHMENGQSDQDVKKMPQSSENDQHKGSPSIGTGVLLSRQTSETEQPVKDESIKEDSTVNAPEKRKAKKKFSTDVANSYAN
jgi:hypothetical protein